LEGDIKGCFDNISHDWLRQHIIIDKHMLNQWLQAGYLHEGKYYDAKSGVPQGGVISATLANMVLDGMSEAIDNSVGKRGQVGLIRYADDFIVTASNQTILTEKVQPAIERFLNSRGLSLSPEKTKITAIETGFDFLGFNVRHYKGKLLIKPAKQAIKAILLTLKQRVKDNLHLTPGQLIRHLNPIIQGWCNYYKHVVAKKTFYYLQHRVFLLLMYWIKRRHPNKSVGWRVKKYFIRQGTRAWVFSGTVQTQKAGTKKVTLYAAGDTVIKRHVKVRAQANPFLPEYFGYFRMRLAHYLKHANWRNRIINNDLCKA
jgi:RNA-directed DNA polymerase